MAFDTIDASDSACQSLVLCALYKFIYLLIVSVCVLRLLMRGAFIRKTIVKLNFGQRIVCLGERRRCNVYQLRHVSTVSKT